MITSPTNDFLACPLCGTEDEVIYTGPCYAVEGTLKPFSVACDKCNLCVNFQISNVNYDEEEFERICEEMALNRWNTRDGKYIHVFHPEDIEYYRDLDDDVLTIDTVNKTSKMYYTHNKKECDERSYESFRKFTSDYPLYRITKKEFDKRVSGEIKSMYDEN